MDDGSWRTLDRRYLYRSPWCSFRVDEVTLPGGMEIEYAVLESGGFAAVVPVTEDGGVVLVRQWRQPLGAFTLELPSGGVDGQERPEAAAGRELREETGYRAEDLERMASMHVSTGRSTEVCHLYRCRAVGDGAGPRPEPTEHIEVVVMPIGEALAGVFAGRITDMATVLGLLWVGAGSGIVGT